MKCGIIIIIILLLIILHSKYPDLVHIIVFGTIIIILSKLDTTNNPNKDTSQIYGSGEYNQMEQALEFPFKVKFISKTPQELFKQIQHESSSLISMPNDRIINVQADKLYDMDVITDLFAEPNRVRVPVYGNLSPLEYYKQNKSKVYALAKRKYHATDAHALRETLYELTKEATLFKASLSKFIYDTFINDTFINENSKNNNLINDDNKNDNKSNDTIGHVLDPCAGWGDRLIGALASDKVNSYTATDTNELMQPVYKRIHNELNPGKKAIVHNMDFFKFESDIKYDLVFTSPPFYNFEMYDGMTEVPQTYEEWLNEWLIPFTNKCIKHAKLNGIVALYLGNTYQTPNMVETIRDRFRAKVIDVFNLPKKRPIQLLIMNPIKLVYVDELTHNERSQLKELTTNKEVMKWVANGQTWNDAKLNKFIAYSKEENKDRQTATNHWFGIINGLTLCGIIGMHKNINNAWSITIYLNPSEHGKGIGHYAIEHAMSLFRKMHKDDPMYIHTKIDNKPMNKLATKLGAQLTNSFKDGYHSYILPK